MKKLDFLKVSFILRKDRMQNDLAPIYLKLLLDSRKAYVSTGQKTKIEHWDENQGRYKGASALTNSNNELLDRLRLDVIRIYNEMKSKNDDVTLDELRIRLSGTEENSRKYLLEICKIYNSGFEKLVGIEIGEITFKRYYNYALRLDQFLAHKYKLKDIPVENIKYSFGLEFEYFLKTEIKLHPNTLIKLIQYLNRVLDYAVQYEWMDKNILSTFKVSTVETNKEYLTQSELDVIQNKEISVDRLSEIRDVFVFCCYTGYAYIDVAQLTNENIVTGINGMKWIYTSRQKTKHTSNVPLMPKAKEIIEKYQEHPECLKTGKLLPVKSNQRTNTYLKELADICGIKKPLTTHIARHTFATTILLSNGVSMESTSKMLGHKSLKTTQIYGKILETRVASEMEMLCAKFSEPSETSL
ncbi:MAG: site-specific integrase, partial [Saprospiraceae bacterium]|nr:site-specific integrase [Saprospiraceae bacterium]